MKKDEIKSKLQFLIAENRIYEALEILSNYVKDIDKYLETTSVSNGFFQQKSKRLSENLISNSDFNTAIARIMRGTYIIERMPEQGNDRNRRK